MLSITMQRFVEELDKATAGRKAFVATGVGSHQSIVARHFSFDYPNRVLLTSCGHGTMGTGLPYLLGAALEQPDYLPILVTGDGSWAIEMPGMITAAQFELPIKVFVLDNGSFGIVRQFEDLNGIPNVATVRKKIYLGPWPDACGVNWVDFADDWERQVRRVIALPGPWFMQVPVADIGVWPILEAGHEAGDMTYQDLSDDWHNGTPG